MAGTTGCPHVENFPLEDVRLLDSRFKAAQDLNVKVLLSYDVDRLLAPFLKSAGLSPKAPSYKHWQGLDGHIGGHYLSAVSLAWAATGNTELKRRMDYMVDELYKAQQHNGDGYVGGVNRAMWQQVSEGNLSTYSHRWAPWYNVHKMFAGLHDAYLYGHNKKAGEMFLRLCDWGISVTTGLDGQKLEQMLDNEYGGMNEVYADAFAMTGNQKYLDTAKRFSHKILFDSMRQRIDNLDNMHANTQIPKVVGYQRIAEENGGKDFHTAASFFWQTVTGHRTLAFGGNSRREHFPSAEQAGDYATNREGPETCNTYNMLKLTNGLFRMMPDARYADYYERAMYNHILSSQHPAHGGYVYFTPARPRHYRTYSKADETMWCCVGTGMENHSRYGEFVYMHTDKDLYVNLYVASELRWEERGLTLRQETAFPYDDKSRMTVNVKKARKMTLCLRHPAWIGAGMMAVSVNGKHIDTSDSQPSSYLCIERNWKDGDVVEVSLPQDVYVEEMPHVPEYIAVMHGPVLLGAATGNESLTGLVADMGGKSQIANGPIESLADAPHLIGTKQSVLQALRQMRPVKDKPLHFTCPELFGQQPAYKSLELMPFAEIHDARYMIYWRMLDNDQYVRMRLEEKRKEELQIAVDNRTVDIVKCGEQQPETDHQMQEENTVRGLLYDQTYRSLKNKGWFTLCLATVKADSIAPSSTASLVLRVTYWGNETKNKCHNIYINGKLLAEERLDGKWNKDELVEQDYAIPADMWDGSPYIDVKFQAPSDASSGGIYQVRLLQAEKF